MASIGLCTTRCRHVRQLADSRYPDCRDVLHAVRIFPAQGSIRYGMAILDSGNWKLGNCPDIYYSTVDIMVDIMVGIAPMGW